MNYSNDTIQSINTQVSFEGFLEMAKFLEENHSDPGPEPSFFGSIYTQFISSNSLTDLVKLHDDRPATPFDEAKTHRAFSCGEEIVA